jgi:hypothetical protein
MQMETQRGVRPSTEAILGPTRNKFDMLPTKRLNSVWEFIASG